MKKNIREFPGYQVDEHGVVYGIKGKPLSSQNHSGGRVRVGMKKDGRPYMRAVSRLVAEAFIPNPLNKPEVDHRDGNRTNNSSSNLRWATEHENNIEYREIQGNTGSNSQGKKLSYDGVEYASIADLARLLASQRGSKFQTVRKEIQRAKYGNVVLYGKCLHYI